MDSFTIRWLRNTFHNRIAVNSKDGSILVYVPAGEFEMGGDHDNDYPKQKVKIEAYWIGIYAVTNAQYLKFMQETVYEIPENSSYNIASLADHPVIDVSWDDALAYALWAACDLPTEAQWEKAAHGPRGFMYPWGNDWNQKKCHHEENCDIWGGTCPVYCYPEGVSGYGTYNQSGNVWEWCSGYNQNRNAADRSQRGLDDFYQVTRGGSFCNGGSLYFRAASRYRRNPDYRSSSLSFRLVKNSH